MLRKIFVSSLLFSLAVLPCLAQEKKVLRISSAKSVQENIFQKLTTKFTSQTGIEIVQVRGLGTTGIQHYFVDLLEGRADAAVASADYRDWVKVMTDNKVEIPAAANITHRVVGRDTMHIIAHKDIGVTDLKDDQIQGLFGGKISNWKELGGKDLPVKFVRNKDKPARYDMFQKSYFGKTLLRKVDIDTSETEFYKVMAETVGALSVDTYKLQAGSIELKTKTPIGRPATMITKGRPSPELEKLINFLRTNSGETAD